MRYFLIFAFAASLAAQEKLVESIEVRVANVDVVVTDHSGKAVTGLTRNDFEVLENGKPQTITNFYEITPKDASLPLTVSAGGQGTAPVQPGEAFVLHGNVAPPDDLRTRRFIFMIDNYSMEPAQRNVVLAAVRKFLDTNFKPGDEAALYLWLRKGQMITPLTNDKAELFRGIDSLASQSRTGMSVIEEEQRTRRDCTEIINEIDNEHMNWDQAWLHCKGFIDAFAQSIWANETTLLHDLKAVMSTLAGIDGRKVIVLAGASLPQHPGRESMMGAAQHFEPHLGHQLVTRAMSEGTAHSQTFAIADVAKFANATGVTFYTIDAADQRNEATADVTLMPTDKLESFMSFTDSAAAYKALADITGGSALTGTQNFSLAFETLSRDLTSYYSLGYKPEGTSGERRIAVRVKKPGLVVHARQSYTPKSSDQDINDRVVANVYHHGAKGEWPIELTAQEPQKNNDRFLVPVTIQMQPNVTLIPQADKLEGGFTLYIVVGNKQGAMSKVTKTTRKIEIPSNAESQFRENPMTFKLQLSVLPGDNIISVGVADQISNATGFDRVEVAAK